MKVFLQLPCGKYLFSKNYNLILTSSSNPFFYLDCVKLSTFPPTKNFISSSTFLTMIWKSTCQNTKPPLQLTKSNSSSSNLSTESTIATPEGSFTGIWSLKISLLIDLGSWKLLILDLLAHLESLSKPWPIKSKHYGTEPLKFYLVRSNTVWELIFGLLDVFLLS